MIRYIYMRSKADEMASLVIEHTHARHRNINLGKTRKKTISSEEKVRGTVAT